MDDLSSNLYVSGNASILLSTAIAALCLSETKVLDRAVYATSTVTPIHTYILWLE